MSKKQVAIEACFTDQVKQDCGATPMFAMIALVAPGYDGPVYCTDDGKFVNTELPIQINLDAEGCLKSCPLLPNSSLNVVDCDGNPATYYEIAIVVADPEAVAPKCSTKPSKGLDNGSVAAKCRQKACGGCYPKPQDKIPGKIAFTTRFILDDRDGSLPACVNLSDVLVDAAGCEASALQCNLFKSCETPWSGITEGCINIQYGDHPDGHDGNGHAPIFSLEISEVEGNALSCREDGLFVALSEWGCEELENCSIGSLGDVDIEGCAIGGVLQWNGAGFVCGPKAQLEVLDGQCTSSLLMGSGSVQNPWTIQYNVDVSAQDENQLVCLDDGLYVPPPSLIAVGLDTSCATTTVEGIGTEADPIIVSTSPIISPNDKNHILCLENGLFVGDQKTYLLSCFSHDCENPSNVTDIDLKISGNGTEEDPLILCPEIIICDTDDNLLTTGSEGLKVSCQKVIDTIGLNVGRGMTYSSDDKALGICISSDPGNIIRFGEDGCLYVPSPEELGSGLKLIGCEKPAISTSVSGLGSALDPFRFCADLNLDSSVKNLADITPEGLLVSPPVFAPGDHCPDEGCFSLEFLGCGTIEDPFKAEAEIKISELEGNSLVCLPDGLYVPESDGSETKIGLTTIGCLAGEISGLGTEESPYDIEIELLLDNSPTNSLRCGPSGLYVLPPDGSETIVTVGQGECISSTISGNGTTSAPYIVTSNVEVSAAEGNQITCLPNGLFVASPEIRVEDSCAIDLEITGSCSPGDPWVLSADIVINDAKSNLLSCDDGLYVGAPNIITSGSGCVTFDINEGSGTLDNPIRLDVGLVIDPSSTNPLSCGPDGLTITPSTLQNIINNYITEGDILFPISDQPNNCLVTLEDGAFVRCPDGSETIVQYVGGKGIDGKILGSGTLANPYVLSSSIEVSDEPDNTLLCLSSGLYVPSTEFQILDSSCITLDMTGLGTKSSPYVLSSDVVIQDSDCNALHCTQDGLFVESRGYLSIAEHCLADPALSLSLIGDGSCGNQYELSASINISEEACNGLRVNDDGLYAAVGGLIDQSHNNHNCPAEITGCVNVNVTGAGSCDNPYFLDAEIIINSSIANNLISCTPEGLLVDADTVADIIINNYVGNGLEPGDDGNLTIKISDDPNNCLSVGNDFGLYVPCPDLAGVIKVTGADSKTVTTNVTGDGSDVDPYVVYSELNINPDPCNAITCDENGISVAQLVSFEIGQDGILDSTASNPCLWRAWCEGTVKFNIAGLAYGSVSNAATHYQIVDQSGDIIHTGFIAPGASYDILDLGEFDVSTGQGFAVRVIAPFPAEDDCDPACGLVIQGTYSPCCN